MDFIARWAQRLATTGAIRIPFEGMKLCLLYADDALFLVKPEGQQIQAPKVLLTVFEIVSGLAINLQKSEIIFSQVPIAQQQALANLMSCKLGTFPFTYLGLPLSNRKLPKSAYIPLIHKLNARLGCWAAKFLSIVGRLVLLNAVLTAMPIFYMSVLKLPDWVIKEIDKIRRTFLWHGVMQEKRKMNLANWQLVCQPKEVGGLGVHDLKVFNQALLQKWAWYWSKPENRLWKPIFSITSTTIYPWPNSPLFKQIQKEFLLNSVLYVPGNGSTIIFWEQDWGHGILKHRYCYLYSHTTDATITLKRAKETELPLVIFMTVTTQEELQQVQKLLSATTLSTNRKDDVKWKWDSKGILR